MRSPSVLRLVTGLVVVSALGSGCQSGEGTKVGDSSAAADACLAQEAKGYPQLEASAAQALTGVAARRTRLGTCEDTGAPAAVLNADVRSWKSIRVAAHWFRQRGWTTQSRSYNLRSPDGGVDVHVFTNTNNNHVVSVIAQFARSGR